ncbi:fMet-Leu-Phe receptor-like [Aplysia californica]|uniref:fMet-Leu-Phe receptor-like n=1 Tax=Aplysia californica TaxID=6500 RepID=A0ABM0JQS9_APLCA|nr:fMet-Leu-Phe receptor-like [Aplysia californica]
MNYSVNITGSPSHNMSYDSGVMDNFAYNVLQYANACAAFLFSVLGIGTNVINVKTFIRMGLDDGVTVSFLGLSVSDLTVSMLNLCNSVSLFCHALERSLGHLFRLDPMWCVVFFTNLGTAIYVVTMLNTVFLALARCMCVVKPLHFKHAFTPMRSVVIIAVFNVFALVLYIPIFVHTGVTTEFSTDLNATRKVIWLSPDREKFKDGVLLISLTIVPFSSQFIVTFCVILLSWSLRKASKFRFTSSSASSGVTAAKQNGDNALDSSGPDEGKNPAKWRLTGKDLQVVRQVVLISTIFIVLNTPMVMLGLSGLLLAGFDASWSADRYVRLYYSGHFMRRVFEQVNSSVNIFIYYSYNTSFRTHFALAWGNKKDKS